VTARPVLLTMSRRVMADVFKKSPLADRGGDGRMEVNVDAMRNDDWAALRWTLPPCSIELERPAMLAALSRG